MTLRLVPRTARALLSTLRSITHVLDAKTTRIPQDKV